MGERLAAGAVLAVLSACTPAGRSGGGGDDCRCTGAVPSGTLDVECGGYACVGGEGYRCTGPNAAVADPVACLPPRPPEAPDVAIVAVSGHCAPPCASDYNPEYLTHDGTSQAIANAFIRHSLTTTIASYGDAFYSVPASAPGEWLVFGFLDHLAWLEDLRDAWVVGYRNPSTVVVLCHSHGCVWAHTALHVLEQSGAPLPVALLIDLDAIATGWEGAGDSWMSVINDYVLAHGDPWPFDVADVTESWNIPGLPAQDIVDVVPASVAGNIEVWSASLVVSDRDPNHRLDGSETGIGFFMSAAEHEDVDAAGSDAMVAIVTAIEEALSEGGP